jgi:hypothetical protein
MSRKINLANGSAEAGGRERTARFNKNPVTFSSKADS